MSKPNSNNETIKQKMMRLDELVEWFEGNEFSLEESFERFATAQKLAAEIEHDLTTFSNKVTVLAKRFEEG